MSQEIRVYLPTRSENLPAEHSLDEEQSHHLRDVLRLKVGAPVTAVLTEYCREYDSEVSNISSNAIYVRLLRERDTKIARCRVHAMLFALAKGEHNEVVCEKCTELGVEQVLIWQAERSVSRFSEERVDKKQTRWQKIAQAAARQSHKAYIPKVSTATGISELLAWVKSEMTANDALWCCSLEENAIEPRLLPIPSGRLFVIVGPEGDLSPAEYRTLREEGGATAISLGPTILRSETAAISAVAGINALWGFR